MVVVAVMPAYNEQDRIAIAIKDAKRFVDYVVVVDDCSTDNTFQVAKKTGVKVLNHIINRGQGASLQTGTNYALNVLQADVIVHFDADGQMQGRDILMLIDPITKNEADIVLGSRFLSNNVKMPFVRRIILKAGVIFTMLVSGIKMTDTHNGFRALSRKTAQKINISLDRMAHASEILDLIKVKKLRFVERPVVIKYSDETLMKGQSSLGAITIVKDILKGKFFDL